MKQSSFIPNSTGKMLQMDLDFYHISLEKRINLLEKRIKRTEDEIFFVKNSLFNHVKAKKFDQIKKQVQLELFAV